jgi:hypothetical protein
MHLNYIPKALIMFLSYLFSPKPAKAHAGEKLVMPHPLYNFLASGSNKMRFKQNDFC